MTEKQNDYFLVLNARSVLLNDFETYLYTLSYTFKKILENALKQKKSLLKNSDNLFLDRNLFFVFV